MFWITNIQWEQNAVLSVTKTNKKDEHGIRVIDTKCFFNYLSMILFLMFVFFLLQPCTTKQYLGNEIEMYRM